MKQKNTMFSVYTVYHDGKRVELRQFPDRKRAEVYAKACAANERAGIFPRSFAVGKVEQVSIFGA